ncbi:MAG: M28 family peptidase, partial [Kiritimatiellia bacterium]|nr:M28 family peptidase [Kiritimatiellia bacterium]
SGLAGCNDPRSSDSGQSHRTAPALDGNRALSEVAAFVELGLRDAGTEGAARAAEYLRERLLALGVEARIDEFTEVTVTGQLPFRNVIGRLPGRGDGLIILGSHFDTKAGMGDGFQGANDSGSSTGLLLELARVLAAGPVMGPEIQFAFFDGEECQVAYGPNDGLHGSRKMARDLVASGRRSDVLAVLVLDMIGDRDLTVTLPRNATPRLLSLAFEAARAEEARRHFSLFRSEILDDHVPFLEQGMPAIVLIDFEYGHAPGLNDYWHTLEDSMDKLSAESLDIVGRVVLRMIRMLDSSMQQGTP